MCQLCCVLMFAVSIQHLSRDQQQPPQFSQESHTCKISLQVQVKCFFYTDTVRLGSKMQHKSSLPHLQIMQGRDKSNIVQEGKGGANRHDQLPGFATA